MPNVSKIQNLIIMGDKFHLAWNTYVPHTKEMFSDLMNNSNYSDVTLVSDDEHQFKVHKFILSACSSVFKSIIDKNSSQNPFIFLRGMNHQELEAILQFIYLGETEFPRDKMSNFLNVARDLNIKNIAENVELATSKQDIDDVVQGTQENTAFVEPNIKLEEVMQEEEIEEKVDENYETLDEEDYQSLKEEMEEAKPEYIGKLKTNVPVYINRIKCDLCDKQFNEKSTLNQHLKIVHNLKKKYPCPHCDYIATQSCNRQRHVRIKHKSSYSMHY